MILRAEGQKFLVQFLAYARDFTQFRITQFAPWSPTSGCFHRGVNLTARPTYCQG
jgi:hypothetical protein